MKAEINLELWVYGDIGAEVRSQTIVEQLAGFGDRDVLVRINSGGGLVFEAAAIFNALIAHKGRVTVSIDGIAASSASYIAMAGDHVEIADNAMLMIHDPFSEGGGNARDLRQSADRLERVAEAMVRGYAAKSGKSATEVRQIMAAETWFTAAEATVAGFADEVTGALDVAAAINNELLARAPEHIQHALTATQDRPIRPATVPNPKPATVPYRSENTMTTKTDTKAASGHNAADFKAAETERKRAIRMAYRPFLNEYGVTALQDACIDDMDISADAARTKLLNKIGEGAEPLGESMRWDNHDGATYGAFRVSGGPDGDGFRAAAVDGILMRNGVKIAQPHAAAGDFRGASIKDIAQASLSRAGRRADDFGADQVIRAAQTTSDFPAILENTAQKALIQGLEAEGTATHRGTWTTEGSLADFKKASRVAMGDAPDLEKVDEGGEITDGPITDSGAEHIQLESYARIVSISRQALINDDLGALTRTPQAMGMAAARKEADVVYNLLAANPKMRDGNALFSTAHGNLAGTGAGITVEAIGAARAAMRKQRSPGSGSYLNIAPTYLLVGADRETEAQKLISQIQADSTANAVPSWIQSLALVVDPRIDDFADGAWFVTGNPAAHDVFEVSYLNGRNAPQIDQEENFDTAAMRWRVMFDFGATALDWRAIFMNPGD